LATGEETGQIEEALGKVGEYYQEEFEQTTDSLKSVIEPILIVFLGGVVLVLLFAVFSPLMAAIRTIRSS
jgi:type IV pilus assembly protein PilC